VRLMRILVWMPLLAFGQEPKKAVSTVPAGRRADTYAVYSAVLAQPGLSRLDGNKNYAIAELSGVRMETEPGSCAEVPKGYLAAFAELQADRAEHHEERFRLERAFNSPKPYDLITEAQVKQFLGSRNWPKPAHGHIRTGGEVEPFPGAGYLITLGNVYFDRQRSVAAVYTSAYCGGLCGFLAWSVFLKNAQGGWDEQPWTTCVTHAVWRVSHLTYRKFRNPL
jgi:hypothetical protein